MNIINAHWNMYSIKLDEFVSQNRCRQLERLRRFKNKLIHRISRKNIHSPVKSLIIANSVIFQETPTLFADYVQ